MISDKGIIVILSLSISLLILSYSVESAMSMNKIRTNKLEYDEVKPGDLLFIDLNFENLGRHNTKYAAIRVTQEQLGISRKLGPFLGPEIDEMMSRSLYLEIPKDAKPGVYSVRISLSDLEGIRRTRYRDFRVTKE